MTVFNINQLKEDIPYDVFTVTEIANLLKGSAHSRYGIIKRAQAKGDIVKLRRGLYALSKRYQRHKINLYAAAQKIYSPSYVSLESALSFHGLIPEAVYTVTSACQKRAREFGTSLGVFTYVSLPRFNLVGVERLIEENEPFLMASPTKALVDYVLAYKKDWTGAEPLVKSLRIEEEDLSRISSELLAELTETYRSRRIAKFARGLRKDLGI